MKTGAPGATFGRRRGGLFSQRLGIPTVVCGPGSIEQAHKPDEVIARDQLQRCDAMMDALLDTLAANDELIL
jgi:acetylornithine deacetylase